VVQTISRRVIRKLRHLGYLEAGPPALVHARHPETRFAVGGSDAFMSEYADELRTLAEDLGIAERLIWTGDCPHVPRLLAGFDVFVWLSRSEGMPHVIAEAGATALPVVATCDHGTANHAQRDTGLFAPHANPPTVARTAPHPEPQPVRQGGQGIQRACRGQALAGTVDEARREAADAPGPYPASLSNATNLTLIFVPIDANMLH
jgi:hypothetical protein